MTPTRPAIWTPDTFRRLIAFLRRAEAGARKLMAQEQEQAKAQGKEEKR